MARSFHQHAFSDVPTTRASSGESMAANNDQLSSELGSVNLATANTIESGVAVAARVSPATTTSAFNPAPTTPVSRKTAITNVRVFDGRKLLEPGIVVIEGDKIGLDSTGAYMVDGRGGVLIPGLIDSHTHVADVSTLTTLRRFGITTALDMETYPLTLLSALREQCGKNGLPDIRSAGIAATYHRKGFAPEGNVESPALARQWVDDRLSEGSDYIKVIADAPPFEPQPDPDTITAVVSVAHRAGKLTVAHATSCAGYRVALRAQADIITHVPLEKDLDDTIVSQMFAENRVVVPTLIMMKQVAENTNIPQLKYTNARESVTAMYHSGIPILAGTDANAAESSPAKPEYGESLHTELELLVQAGMSTVDVLRSATILPAQKFGLDDRGIIVPGRRADLVLLSDDPIEDIKNTRKIQQVWCNGAGWIP